MPNLEVNIFKQKLKLSYQENEKKRLLNAVEKLNKKWNEFSKLHGRVSDLKIITLISLELQDSIYDIEDLKDKLNLQENKINTMKKEFELKNNEFTASIETINNLKSKLDKKNEEIVNVENNLDVINDELLKIKSNIIKNYHE